MRTTAAQPRVRTTPPVALASYASRLPDSHETLHGPPPCTVESTPAPHLGLTPRPVPAHNAPKVLDIPGKSWDFPWLLLRPASGLSAVPRHDPVLFDAPQIPAGIQSFQWIPVEWDRNLEKLKKIHRNETESSGMEPESTRMGPESTGMARIHRNDWRKKIYLFIYELKVITYTIYRSKITKYGKHTPPGRVFCVRWER